MQNANGGEPNLYASVDVIPVKGTNSLWSQKKHPMDKFRPKEDTTTLTTHPATSHNIKLNQKGGCTQLFEEKLRMYVTFGQKPMYTEKAVVKRKPRVKPIKGSVNG